MLDSARLIFDLQKVNGIIQRISGCLDAKAIATEITEALVHEFGCIFTRIWLTEPGGNALELVASSGLYTRTDGDFARVPMGAYKVGKIAKTCIPFLSNHLADETWVKDRDWAIANNIHGFAGYPLARQDRVIGVLAAFSTKPFFPEFLEVLQVLCMAVTIAVDSAQQVQRIQTNAAPVLPLDQACLSDHLSSLLTSTNLSLVGTEQPLTPGLAYLLLRATEILNQLHCSYCRLTYGDASVLLEGIMATPSLSESQLELWRRSHFGELEFLCNHLQGSLNIQLSDHRKMIQLSLDLPYRNNLSPDSTTLLSDREKQVLALLAQGLRDKAIAQELFISESTVKFHLNSTQAKLGAKNRYQAIYQATKQGLI